MNTSINLIFQEKFSHGMDKRGQEVMADNGSTRRRSGQIYMDDLEEIANKGWEWLS